MDIKPHAVTGLLRLSTPDVCGSVTLPDPPLSSVFVYAGTTATQRALQRGQSRGRVSSGRSTRRVPRAVQLLVGPSPLPPRPPRPLPALPSSCSLFPGSPDPQRVGRSPQHGVGGRCVLQPHSGGWARAGGCPGLCRGAVTYFHSSVGSGDPREPDTRARGTQLSAPRRAAACALTVPTPEVAWRRRAWFLTPGRTRSGCCSCEACRACGVCTAGTCWPPSTCHPSPSSATWAVSTARARRRCLSRCGRGASEPQLSPGALDGRARKRPRTAGEGCRAPSCHRLEPTTEVRAEGWTQPRLSGRWQDLPRLPGPRPRPRVSGRD